MTGLIWRFVHESSGRLLWLNLAVLVALKAAIPLGSLGLATISGVLELPDSAAIVREINTSRLSEGVSELTRSHALDIAAEKKLDDMAARGYFAHVSPDGLQAWDFMMSAGYRYRTAGENLARGFGDPAELVAAWMNSPSHRANVLGAAYRDTGVAVRRVTIDGYPATVVVQLFGAPSAVAAAPAPVRAPAPKVASAPAPQRVSTDTAIAPVVSPIPAATVAGASAAASSRTLSAVYGGYLVAVLVLLTLAGGWVGMHRRLTVGWIAHAVLVLAVVALPQVTPAVRQFIF